MSTDQIESSKNVPSNSEDNAPVLFNSYKTQDGHHIAEMTLNSPKSLNALSVPMCQLMSEQLIKWQEDDSIVAVILRGAGDKAFCAGGDIRKLYDSMDANAPLPNPYANEFFGSEYALYRQMHFYSKPLILWGNGFIMGGGMGLMAACSHRIVTETTKFAMPEITIGIFPDASGSWFLQRMPAKTGLFMGLTGAMGNANDAKFSNLAEYALPSKEYEQVVETLTHANWNNVHLDVDVQATQTSVNAYTMVSQSLSALSSTLNVDLKPSNLAQYWQTIEAIMMSGGLADIDTILQDDSKLAKFDETFAADKWVQRAVATYRQGCPVTAALTYELFHRVRDLSLEQVLYLEAIVAVHCANNPDFREGVRALLIDKDKNPQWSRTLEQCLNPEGVAYINSHFDNPYPDGEHIFNDWLGVHAKAVQKIV